MSQGQGWNPILPKEKFTPDVEARVFNGRMYLYGSNDEAVGQSYCSDRYYVYSSCDMKEWKEEGISFTSAQAHRATEKQMALYAPDCIRKNGTYYLYYCQPDGSEGVAQSNYPAGPFSGARAVEGADGSGIDPAVFIDDDGQAYFYWGQFRLKAAKLHKTMYKILPETLQKQLIDEAGFGFHEGASIRKRNGIYYLIYTDISRGKATCLSYATAKSPLGPFQKGGIILDNIGCDPNVWNNHGSIAEFGGQWYVFYHRASMGTEYNRRVCVEKIFFEEDGRIQEVRMTTQGAGDPVDPQQRMEAYRACEMNGTVHTMQETTEGRTHEYLCHIEDGDWMAYRYFRFARPMKQIKMMAGAEGGAVIEVRLDAPEGEKIGECMIKPGGWQIYAAPVMPAAGIRALYLTAKAPSGTHCCISYFEFC